MDDIQNIYPNDNKFYIKDEEENKDLNEENDQFQFFLKESLSNKDFLSNCANKILKEERLIIEEKLRIINIHKNYKDKYSIHNLSDILGVERSTISRWIKKENEYRLIENKDKLNLPGQGLKSCFYEKEADLIYYFYELRKENIAVNSNLLIKKMYELKPDLKGKSFNSVQKLLYRLLKKNNITIRKATHIGQPLPDNSYNKVYDFIYEVIKKRKKLDIKDDPDNLNRIINVDETPIYLEFFTDKTYNKKGAKEVIIKTNGNEKKHVTVILAVSASGKKLPPDLIFKGKSDKNNEKRYNRLNVVKNKRILIFFQENGWINDSIFKKWFDNIYLEHENKVKKKCLLLLDKTLSHLTKNIISYLEINQTEYTLIPGKLTRFLQPLDIGINMPFKSQLKNKFLISEANKLINIEEVKIINFNDNLSISNMDKLRLNLIEWILSIWEDDTLIKPTTITASFKKTTITYPLDGSMDIDFEMPEEIVNQYNKE